MSISADQSRLTARVGGADYAVVSVCGQEAFNHPFSFALELVVPGFPALTNQLGSSVSLSMLATSGQQRTLYGLVTEVAHIMGLPDGQQLWRIEVSSHLYRLQQATDTRLLLDHSLPEIIQLLCRRHGLDDNALFCDFSQSYPARPTTLQAGESDFDFLARLCSRNGILFWSAASDEQEVLHFSDTASHCRPLARPALEYRASASLEHDANDNDLLTMKLGAQLVSDRYMVHDVAESAPGQELLSARELPGAGKSVYGTTEVRFGRGVTSADAASEATQLLAHIGTSQQLSLTITSHAVDLRVGRIVRIEADRFGSGVSGDYLITAMTHRLKQYAGLGLGGEEDCPYTNTVTLVPRETPYRVAETRLPTVPLTITARIESKDQTAQLDSAGRTRYHQHNDSVQKPFGQNSVFTRRLQPYGGTGNGHQPGFHMPLQDGAEILVSCLNNDPDRLVIVGSLPNPENHSPVTASNAAQNRLRTMNDQELMLDDTVDAPVISLRTFAGHNILHLNASKAEHLIRLATEQGLAEFYAKQTIDTTSGDTLTETVGNNRIQVVEDKHETITNSAEIHHQSATDVLLRGANNIDLESGKNTEFEVGNDMRLDIREAMNIKVGGSSAAININSGSMILDADGAINIQGDGGGDISIGQAGGGIKIDPAGNITLFGTNVNFAGAVSMSGKVNMAITSPPSVAAPAAINASSTIGVNQLSSPEKEQEDTTIRPIYPVRYAYVNFFGDNLAKPSDPPSLNEMLNQSSTEENNGYAARILRPGWIYIKEEGVNDGYFHIFKYEHKQDGEDIRERFTKYLFKNGINAQGGLQLDDSGAFGLKGYPFVFVRKKVSKISIAYSEHEWHPNVIDTMNGSSRARAKTMQKVNLLAADRCTVTATESHFKALVEDYRSAKDRILNLQKSTAEPDFDEKFALDSLLTQGSFDLDAEVIAKDLRDYSPEGDDASIVGLYDPVGRQRDIAEIHIKLLLWQKRFSAQNLYPYTIGTFISQLQKYPDDKLQDVLNDSINFAEYNQYWGDLHDKHELFNQRLKQFTQLYKAFMEDEALIGRAGSLDTYFENFFSFDLTVEKEKNKEIQKLCDTVDGIFNGITSSQPGLSAIESLHDQAGNKEAFYARLIKILDKAISMERKTQFHANTLESLDKVFGQLGGVWGKAVSVFKNSPEVAIQANYQINKLLCDSFLPKVFSQVGLEVPDGQTVAYTTDELAKLIAQHLDEGVGSYPAENPGKTLDKALNRVAKYQKLFDWGQRSLAKAETAQRKWQLSKVNQVSGQGATSAGRFKPVAEGVGLFVSGSFAGIWTYFNLKTLNDLAHQTNYDAANPVDRGNHYHDMVRLSSSVVGLTNCGLTIAKSVTGLGELFAGGLSGAGRVGTALAPQLGTLAKGLGLSKGFFSAVLSTQLMAKALLFLNFAAAVDSTFNAITSYRQGNYGEMAGHVALGVGALAFLYVAYTCEAAAVTAEAAGIGASPFSFGSSAVIGTIIGGLLTGAGAWLIYKYSKTDFQVLLENCFWGSGSKYMLWVDENRRPTIDQRLALAEDMLAQPKIQTAYNLETQEFLNYFYQPQLTIEDNKAFFSSIHDQFTYTYIFVLPNFQTGVSELRCEVYGQEWKKHNRSSYEANEELQKKLYTAIKQAQFIEKDGQTTVTVKLNTDRQVRLHWYYEPSPHVISPRRYLTKDGLITTPLIGMINEEPA